MTVGTIVVGMKKGKKTQQMCMIALVLSTVDTDHPEMLFRYLLQWHGCIHSGN